LNYEKFCKQILKIDKKIRYAGIYDAGIFHHELQNGVKSYLTEEETEVNLSQAVYRWGTRKKVSKKIGNPVFSMAKYGKIYRLTFPLDGAGLVLISTELDVDPIKIAEKILKLKKKI